ncbi:MAG: extracellular solute-binding protein [Spirochaetia bacterium]|nr:extracellular solute-binding protein [Spirochaetia bacterium]
MLRQVEKKMPGERLPSDKQLSDLAGISYVTVQKAVNELAREGYLRREVGRGTFVAERATVKNKLRCYVKGVPENRSFSRTLLTWAEQTFDSEKSCLEISEAPGKWYGGLESSQWISPDADLVELDGISRAYKGIHGDIFFPLNQSLDESHLDVFSVLRPDYFSHFSRNGLLYTATPYFLPSILLYNPTVFSELKLAPPDTRLDWDGFFELCRKIASVGLHPIHMGRMLPFIFQNEGEIFSPNRNECLVDSPACHDAFSFYLKILRLDPASPSLIGFDFWDYYGELFIQNRLAMRIGTPDDLHFFLQKKIPVGATLLPKGRRRATVVAEQSYAVLASSTQANEGGKFLSHLFSSALQTRIADETYYPPAHVRIFDTKCRENTDPLREIIYRSMTDGFFIPELKSGRLNETLRTGMNQVLLEKKSLTQALKDMKETIQEELKNEKA